MKVGKYSVDTSNEDKILFPEAGITKGDLIWYYDSIAEAMLPHLKDRAVTMRRFPDGIAEAGFYHKNMPGHFPDWMDRVTVEKEGGTVTHVVCNKRATLVYLANFGCITPHVWLSRRDRLYYPDRLIFDLDPSDEEVGPLKMGALSLKAVLEELGFVPYLMTTGSRGFHVVAPLDRSAHFDDVRTFARELATFVADRHPGELTVEMRKNKRAGRIFVDFLRNAYAQTAVPPFSVRARPGAPVATPLSWDELEDDELKSDRFSIKTIFKRLEKTENPWKDIGRHATPLERCRQKFDQLKEVT